GGARLQQRLELPGLRPFGVVAPVGGQGAHQRAVLALGAQVRVDLPQGALAGPFGAGAGELAGEGGADGDHVRLDLGGELTVLAHQVGGGGDDVHDVDVGEVVELASAGLPSAITAQRTLSWPSTVARAIAEAASSAASARSLRAPETLGWSAVGSLEQTSAAAICVSRPW